MQKYCTTVVAWSASKLNDLLEDPTDDDTPRDDAVVADGSSALHGGQQVRPRPQDGYVKGARVSVRFWERSELPASGPHKWYDGVIRRRWKDEDDEAGYDSVN